MLNHIIKIHIVLVANTLWSIYNFRKGIIKDFLNKGYKVTIIGPDDRYTDKLKALGCEVECVAVSSQGKNPLKDLLLIFRLRNIYKRINPDFIFHYTIKPNIYGSIAAGLSGNKSIAITTGLGYAFNKSSVFTKMISSLYSFAFKFAMEVWFLNEDDKSIFVDKKIINIEKAFVLDGEGVDTDFFSPVSCEVSDNSKPITFLLVSRMLWDKGVGVYVEAARKIKIEYPNVKFQLLGACDVENPSAISRDIIDSWHSEGVIEYLGVTNDVRTNVSETDCIVLPSYYREGIPRTLMEAAAMGKPIITTDNVGCRNVVIDCKTGFLCEVKNADSLAQSMRNIINMEPVERLAMGLKGREYMISRFDEKVIIADYHNVLKKYLTF
ncbi:glycosyltransferase family 4 protein [Rahnella inusitata]|uniref:glycosyltransferase family 4 protein n=1 Tax=Rahnella inusitata TaxID=58169 RepID=UPI0039BEBFB6